MQTKAADQKFCSDCAAVINIKAELCPHCGVRQAVPAGVGAITANNGLNKKTAGILALFLGGIGLHKFYMNKPMLGVVYLVFCWTYIPAVLGFIEAIIIFNYTDAEFNEQLQNS